MEVTPVESFNKPDIFLGITRALEAFEGGRASDPRFISRLQVIQNDLLGNESISLVPSDPQRNVIRRQGRYWRGLGVLSDAERGIHLTPLGKALASGKLTTFEFALKTVFSHELPNRLIEKPEVVSKWESHGISLHPLSLIIDIIKSLVSKKPTEGYLTPHELARVVVPLSIISSRLTSEDYADGILQFRSDPNSIKHFPDCAEASNDLRMVREHLLFLANYDLLVCNKMQGARSLAESERYSLSTSAVMVIGDLLQIPQFDPSHAPILPPIESAVGALPNIDLGAIREKKIAEVTTRPNQAKFRKLILQNHAHRCLLTGEVVKDVLDACHIIAVSDGGKDSVDNGLCLRKDIHTLFDRGKIRVSDAGEVKLSPDLEQSPTYQYLPQSVSIPDNVNKEFLRKRFNYGMGVATI
jgi:hypothetical protein